MNAARDIQEMAQSKYPPIEDLIPHGPPMRAIEEMIEWEPGRASCRLQLRRHAPFVKDNRIASVVALEYLAQSVAACLGYEAYIAGGKIRVGMIVGVRKMEIFSPTITVGAEVRADVERIRGDEDVSTFRGEALADSQRICVAHMTLVHPESPPT